jgi:multisubunit Na+/H+ antiporter MnhG subunit
MTHDISLSLIALGCFIIAAASIGAVTVRGDMFLRLHFVTPVTSAGTPLVAIGVCVASGQPWVIAEVLLITTLLFMSGAVLEASTGRAMAQVKGIETDEQPK